MTLCIDSRAHSLAPSTLKTIALAALSATGTRLGGKASERSYERVTYAAQMLCRLRPLSEWHRAEARKAEPVFVQMVNDAVEAEARSHQ